MAEFTGTIITNAGRTLLAKAQTGVQLTFTRVGLGDGVWQSDTNPETLPSLVNEKLSLPINDISIVGDGTVKLRFILTNENIVHGFFLREIGIFANDPDVGEILYAVTYTDKPDYIPTRAITPIEYVVDLYTVIDNAENITITISDTVVIASRSDLEALRNQLLNQLLTGDITVAQAQHAQTADTLSGFHASQTPTANTILVAKSDGKLDPGWLPLDASINADTVDGFHASQTPAPNTIPVADSTGKLYPGWLPLGGNAFSRIDLTNATSDYDLQVGEEAYISFSNTMSVPLRIATDNNKQGDTILQI